MGRKAWLDYRLCTKVIIAAADCGRQNYLLQILEDAVEIRQRTFLKKYAKGQETVADMNATLDENPNATSPKDDPRSVIAVSFEVALLSIVIIVAIVGNAMILTAIYRFTCLQTKTNAFVVNLALADLLLSVLAMPFTLASSVTYDWVFGDVMCRVHGVFNSLFCEASILTLTFVSLERFVAILYPLRYEEIMTARTTKIMVAYIWGQATFCATSTFLFSRFTYIQSEFLCTVDWGYSTSYTLVFAFIFLFIPFSVVSVMYCKILRTALTQQKKICAMNLGEIADKEGEKKKGRNGKRKEGFQESHRKIKREHKATVMIAIVVGTFCICWIPHAVGVFCIIDPDCHWADSFYTITTWLTMLNSAMNSVIYGLMNHTFRRAFKSVLLCGRYSDQDIDITRAVVGEKTAYKDEP